MSSVQIRHDPFARECLMRDVKPAGKCENCGVLRPRLFRYYFTRDDSMRRSPLRRDDLNFCNIGCMRQFHCC